MSTQQNAAAEWRGYWYLPFVAALGYATSVIHVYTIGPFIGPLQTEFGWSRAEISIGLTVSSIISALFCIPIGMLVDKIGPRRIGLIGVVLMTAAFALLSSASGSISNWVLLWTCIAFATLGVQATVWTSAVNSRFEKSRGLALAVTLSGASLSAAIFPLLATWLIGAYGWRMGFVGLGAAWAAIVFPFLLLFFRGARDQSSKAVPVPAKVLTGLTLSEGFRTFALYKLLLAAGLFSFTAIGALVHFVPILTGAGTTRLEAASIAGLIGIFSLVGRLGTGFLLDRFSAQKIGALAFMLPVIGISLLLLDASNHLYQSIAAATLGLTVGAEVDVIAFLAAKHFGLKNFGSLYGAMVMALSLGTSFGPLTAGAVFDHYGSYAPFLMLNVVLMTLSAITLLSLGSPPAQAAAEVVS
ncbi:MFS transporter [Stenotrophobium rhamnosiphilum]|uniref:MFS transporter n=1 Tax=Stenotrophobium rhamnosiphilum TaxID=2029166 RepID=A0A2T5MD43_9GAMM|nr:MFS transporter [Stenotrophobium rhamnosiphilum]PTU30477.1 MFS transporter [Stenotrophobium rhamnosiphilum]